MMDYSEGKQEGFLQAYDAKVQQKTIYPKKFGQYRALFNCFSLNENLIYFYLVKIHGRFTHFAMNNSGRGAFSY